MPPPTEQAPAPKKGSVKEDLFKDLRARAKQDSQTPDAPAAPDKPALPKADAKPDDAAPAPAGDPKPADVPAGTEDPKKPKVSPWKLVEEYKSKLAAAEAKALETDKRAIPESKWKEHQDKLSSIEKRAAELEEEIRYVNYSKSAEFKSKYQEPYERAWSSAMGELGELTIESAEGARAFQAQDLLELVNLPLGKAHELAVEKFGDLAGEVMGQRKEIRKLFDAQAAALDEARKSGAEREKTQTEKQQREFGEVSSTIKETWSKANEEITADPKYGKFFTPIDGDEQGNQRLAKGFELADRAFSENPLAPGLTPEQRQAIVKRHAAVRNRCAAFGRQAYQLQQKDARIVELQKQLDEFKGADPEARGSQPAPAANGKGTTMDSVLGELRKKAKQN